MKGLGSEYLNSDDNGKFLFDVFFTKKKKYLSMALERVIAMAC